MTTNVIGYLNTLALDLTSPIASIQRVRQLIEEAADPMSRAKEMVLNLSGQELTDVDSLLDARMIAMGLAERAVRAEGVVDESAFAEVIEHVKSFHQNPAMSWMYAAEIKSEAVRQSTDIGGVTVDIQLTDDGRIKKGGKQMIVREMYKQLVVNAEQPLNSGEFTQEVIKRLGMSLAGARTYTFNCTKEFGAPEGFAGQRGKKKVELTAEQVAEKEAAEAAEKAAKKAAKDAKNEASKAKKEAEAAEKAAKKEVREAERAAKKAKKEAEVAAKKAAKEAETAAKKDAETAGE